MHMAAGQPWAPPPPDQGHTPCPIRATPCSHLPAPQSVVHRSGLDLASLALNGGNLTLFAPTDAALQRRLAVLAQMTGGQALLSQLGEVGGAASTVPRSVCRCHAAPLGAAAHYIPPQY